MILLPKPCWDYKHQACFLSPTHRLFHSPTPGALLSWCLLWGLLIVSGPAPTQTSDLSLNGTSGRLLHLDWGPFVLWASWCTDCHLSDSHMLVPHVFPLPRATHEVEVGGDVFAPEPKQRVPQRNSTAHNFGKEGDCMGEGQVTRSPGALWELWAGGFSQSRG